MKYKILTTPLEGEPDTMKKRYYDHRPKGIRLIVHLALQRLLWKIIGE